MRVYCSLGKGRRLAEVVIEENCATVAKVLRSKDAMKLIGQYPQRSFEKTRQKRRMAVIRQDGEDGEVFVTFGVASKCPGDWFPYFSRDIGTTLAMRKGEIDFLFTSYDIAWSHAPNLVSKFIASIGDMR